MSKYEYDIVSWEPVNTNSFNLLSKVKINPDIKLLELFELAPLHNILCKVSGTNSKYDNKVVYAIIDKSMIDNSYYATLDHVWNSYPDKDKNGKIEFLKDTVYDTIDYIKGVRKDPIINLNLLDNYNKPMLNENVVGSNVSGSNVSNLKAGKPDSINPADNEENKSNEKNKKFDIKDVLIPVGISLIVTGLLQYVLSKKFFD